MKKKHIYLILCFLWMLVIFWFSHQPANSSQAMSNSILEMVDRILHTNIVTQGGWLFNTLNFLVRKAAHMSEYALLAILFILYLRECEYQHMFLIGIIAVALYAASDEFHQLFVMGRSGQIKDVLIDTCGGMIGIVLLQCILWIKQRYKIRKQMMKH